MSSHLIFMDYNTKQKKLVLPEYGRNIQNMVDYCVSIKDRDERTRCANSIIVSMGNLFPHLRDINDFKHILWDHLAIMADFKLDIDYPYDIVKKEELNTKPDPIEYKLSSIHYRHYGKIIENMIQRATEFPEGPERDQLVKLIANQMKRSYVVWNKDSVEDEKIFKDLFELSKGLINITPDQLKLTDCKELIPRNPQPINNKKNNQRKNR